MSSHLKKLPEFLKPYFIELLDTLWYMIKDIFSLIVSILPKKQMIYSWRLKRVIPNIRRYSLFLVFMYFLFAILISKVIA